LAHACRPGRRHLRVALLPDDSAGESSGFLFPPLFSPSMNLSFKYNHDGLIPAIVQDATTRRVLMMAWMNASSLETTLRTGLMHYWSRSRNKFWLKGETSGHIQQVVRWAVDCDADTLLFEVEQIGGACHTGYQSCFFQTFQPDGTPLEIVERKTFDPTNTYQTK
jgi:phosphoribosyl-AMP cyclohydrolase